MTDMDTIKTAARPAFQAAVSSLDHKSAALRFTEERYDLEVGKACKRLKITPLQWFQARTVLAQMESKP